MKEKQSVTLPGTVEQIIKSCHPSIPEKAEIAVQGADEPSNVTTRSEARQRLGLVLKGGDNV